MFTLSDMFLKQFKETQSCLKLRTLLRKKPLWTMCWNASSMSIFRTMDPKAELRKQLFVKEAVKLLSIRPLLVAHLFTYAPPRCRTSQYRRIFSRSQCPSGTILLAQYSMVWDWRASRAGPMLFYWPSCSIPTIVFYYFSLSLLYVYRLVLWGWCLRTDRVYITFSQPCTAVLFTVK